MTDCLKPSFVTARCVGDMVFAKISPFCESAVNEVPKPAQATKAACVCGNAHLCVKCRTELGLLDSYSLHFSFSIEFLASKAASESLLFLLIIWLEDCRVPANVVLDSISGKLFYLT